MRDPTIALSVYNKFIQLFRKTDRVENISKHNGLLLQIPLYTVHGFYQYILINIDCKSKWRLLKMLHKLVEVSLMRGVLNNPQETRTLLSVKISLFWWGNPFFPFIAKKLCMCCYQWLKISSNVKWMESDGSFSSSDQLYMWSGGI